MELARAAIVAHQGGWDEALLLAGPLLAIVGLLWLAKRRADRLPPTGFAKEVVPEGVVQRPENSSDRSPPPPM